MAVTTYPYDRYHLPSCPGVRTFTQRGGVNVFVGACSVPGCIEDVVHESLCRATSCQPGVRLLGMCKHHWRDKCDTSHWDHALPQCVNMEADKQRWNVTQRQEYDPAYLVDMLYVRQIRTGRRLSY